MMRAFITALFVAVITAAAVLGLLASDRDIPVRRIANLEVVGTPAPGGKLRIRWSVVRDKACSSTKQEVIVDTGGARWILPQQVSIGPPGPVGVMDTFITQTDLPKDVPPGPARLRVLLAYTCNPTQILWPVVDQVPEVPFTVLPAS